ncbi:hypothetical protein Pla52o_27780 [Novipirellula galeiformis]|uniref:Uncharacterized protein n=1 Tax=Novipirellula galeiformis TaxID=2528004 RepID=A0A5C6CGC9_9BACT|nr:hypothetical protein [Novipirellula galeiformis]TWU23242.1 hypothetical protein Pla52o_27780 [Novipirellula galeiformis]
MSQWVFAELSGAAVRRDPQETELFKTEDAGEGEYAGTDALVREVIQNSMDAGTGDGPVRVRFALHPHGTSPGNKRLAEYFARLQPGLTYRDVEFNGDGVPALPNGFLVCEDFGTRGLGGDPYRATDPPNGTKGEDFFWFWRNIGRSGKTGDDLGRWGLGKTVYRAASRVGCMLGMTVRHADGQKLLMGQAVLKIHKHQGTEHAAEGYWCGGCNETDTVLPINDEAALAQFASEWNLTRKNEPGLSVVVPFVADELKAESILRLVAVNFFVPVVQKRLVVEIAGDGLPGGQTEYRVDDQTIGSVCKKLSWTGKARQKLNTPPPVEFAKKCFDATRDVVSTKLLGESRIPSMTEEAFDSETLQKLRKSFADEELVAIRVQSALPKKAGGHEIGELNVYLQRTAVNDRFESYYVREGMTITRLNSKPSMRGTRALVTVDPGPLASLLGDTEGPSHVSWDTSNDERPNRVWKTWKGRVKFFAKIVDSLVELLTPPPEEADFDLLSDFFSIEQLESPQRKRKPKSDGERTRDFDPPEPSPRWYRMHGREGGFQICDSSQLPTPVGASLRVSVAYDMPSGNPMKHWSNFDFDFRTKNGPIKVTGKGITAAAKDGNVIEMKIKKEDFSLNASGFDIHRDLIVRIDEVQEDPEQTEVSAEMMS